MRAIWHSCSQALYEAARGWELYVEDDNSVAADARNDFQKWESVWVFIYVDVAVNQDVIKVEVIAFRFEYRELKWEMYMPRHLLSAVQLETIAFGRSFSS